MSRARRLDCLSVTDLQLLKNPRIKITRKQSNQNSVYFLATEMEDSSLDIERLSIYKAARTIKRRDNSLYNALRSIYEDSIFVAEISQLWPELPLLANLRCGLWYSRTFHSTCYFKSTDGHTNNWSFNTSRLNLHVALLAGNISYRCLFNDSRECLFCCACILLFTWLHFDQVDIFMFILLIRIF